MLNKETPIIKPFQHYIDEKEFEKLMDNAARGNDFPPNMKCYSYMFCVFMWFFRKVKSLENRLERLESIAQRGQESE